MKKLNLTMLLALLLTGFVYAQKGTAEMTIKTSVVCGMCKDKIEKELVFEKGVKEVKVDMEKKTVWVKYRSDKSSPEKVKAALTKIGYRADEIAADPKAFEKLPACCKAEGCGKD